MDSIEFFQVFIIIIILILTLLYMSFRSYTSSSSSSSSSSTSSVAAVDTDTPPLQDSSSSVGAVDTDILPLKERYDVFLSFRGEDTRLGFTSHLHKALLGKKIETYIDNRLVRGDEIAPALLEAIERSTISVIIFSKNYASSTWCLKELVHILGCKKRRERIVIPIFYGIDPSDLRNQQGTYALALDELEKRFKGSTDEVVNWRDALKEAAGMAGFPYSSKTGRTESDFVEEVVQDVLTKLNRESSSDLQGLVGIEKKIEEIESLLCLDSPVVCCVGIWGMGGIGKTTLADAVFHRHSSKFEVCCFLANVREKSEKTDGLNDLRDKLVGDILKDKDVKIDTPSIPPNIQDRLRRTKALIVLDDVNDEKQLEDLVGENDRFCQGSRIIITARDKGLLGLKVDHAKIFNVEGLGSDEALQLFHSHAFGSKSPTTDYTELSRKVVHYINGIPLALKLMGSLFHRCKSKREWEVQWEKLKQFPIEKIEKALRISYDGLGKHEKEIFLDIACFHKDCERNYVKVLLDSRNFLGEAGINDLIDRSLISISYSYNKALIKMHDLVQEMGKAIAQEQGSRLFMAKDVNQLLANNQSDGHVQAISICWREMEYANFEKMRELRLLRVHSSYEHLALIGSLGLPNSLRSLAWDHYPLKSLPSKFSAQNLVVLKMPYSKVEGQLWNEDQSPKHLKRINLEGCIYLTKVPDLSRSLQIEHIDLNSCQRLVEIPSYFQHLGELTYLDLGRCKKIKNLPEMPCNLEFLNLSMTAIEELPSSVWSHEKISYLNIEFCEDLKSLPSNTCKLKLSLSLEGCESLCEFWELPRDTTKLALPFSTIKELRNASIESVVGLTAIKLYYCESLVSLPTNIWKLKSLKSLDLSDCSNLQHFPEISEAMEHLEFLNLSGTMVKELPQSIGNLVVLRELDLRGCKNLVSLPTNIWKLNIWKSRKILDLSGCSNLQHFPEISEAMEHLEFLNLSGTMVKELPQSIGNLVALRELDLCGCNNLVSLPTNIWKLKSLKSLDLSGCSNLQHFPEISEAMEHLEFLNLSGTMVKELPQSIGNLVALQKLDLVDVNNLVSLPTNIWKLNIWKFRKSLALSGCSNLQHFPEISEAMEHQEFLNLSGTMVKELPQSIGNLVALQKLDLRGCNNLVNLPTNIWKLKSLKSLGLNCCKSLESLPELPPLVQCLEANGCTSLKTVSSSSTAITQGWEEYKFYPGLFEVHSFSNCPKLDENARSNIMGDAQLRIMRMATASSRFKEDKIEKASYNSNTVSSVGIRYSGNEIPKWFSHKSEGCSIKIELPRDWFSTDFLGFALSLVVANDRGSPHGVFNLGCKYNFKTSNGESHEVNHPRCNPFIFGSSVDSPEVLVWWCSSVFEEVVEGAQSPTAFYKLVTEVNVDFTVWSGFVEKELEMKKCGICLLYGKDAEMIKQRAL